MKRILFVLALMLILTVCFVGEAFALNRPWSEAGTIPDGDEHPWGGDENNTDPQPFSIKIGGQGTFATGIMPVDLLFRFFFLDKSNIIEENNSVRQDSQSRLIDFPKNVTVKNKGIRK